MQHSRIGWKFNIKRNWTFAPIIDSSWNRTIWLLVLCRQMTRWLIVHLLLFYSVHNPIDHIILLPSCCSCCIWAGQDSHLAYFWMGSLFPVHFCSWFILIENPLNGCRPLSLYPGNILSWCPKEEESYNGRRAILNTLWIRHHKTNPHTGIENNSSRRTGSAGGGGQSHTRHEAQFIHWVNICVWRQSRTIRLVQLETVSWRCVYRKVGGREVIHM